MADEIQQPTPPSYPYGVFKHLSGTSGIPSHPDTFIGPRDKVYVDFLCRDVTRLRGTNAYYYVKLDHPRRIDGDHPISNNPDIDNDALARKRHAGMALYGEHVIVGESIDTVRDEVQPDWPYSDPILVRGIAMDLDRDEEADEKGSIFIRGLRFVLARVLCEKEWNIRPRTGDVIRFTKALRGYYDVEYVETEEPRMGSNGNFTEFRCQLRRNTKFEPQRKIAEQKKTSDEEIQKEQTSGPPPELY